jgi:thiamine-monophosphate kinase
MEPFNPIPEHTVASLGEKELLKRIRDWLGDAAPPAPAGMGDDCAILPDTAPAARLITTDSVVLGRHFTERDAPGHVGAKLLNRNLSDIAAMGGSPSQAVIAGFLPRSTDLDWLRKCLRGIAAVALRNGVQLVGGDLTETTQDLALNLTLLGSGERFLQRKGGQPGDWICLTGPVGGSLYSNRHLRFVPRLEEGRMLATHSGVHACIDVSDGLAIDLLNLLPEDAAAVLDPAAIPVHPDAFDASADSGRSPFDHALNDGEDHELLFLCAADETAWRQLEADFITAGFDQPRRIGQLIARPGADRILDRATGQPFASLQGYDHFR